MERPLGIFETAETLTDAAAPFNVVGVIELDTGISSDGLSSALERAQRRHPLLRARIVDPGDGWRYDLGGAPPIPLEIIERRDASHWREIAETELNRAFDIQAGPLMRCSLLAGDPGTTASELIVSILHTVIDGTSAINLVNEILEDWNATTAGLSLKEPEVLDLQPPVEAILPLRIPRSPIQTAHRRIHGPSTGRRNRLSPPCTRNPQHDRPQDRQVPASQS